MAGKDACDGAHGLRPMSHLPNCAPGLKSAYLKTPVAADA